MTHTHKNFNIRSSKSDFQYIPLLSYFDGLDLIATIRACLVGVLSSCGDSLTRPAILRLSLFLGSVFPSFLVSVTYHNTDVCYHIIITRLFSLNLFLADTHRINYLTALSYLILFLAPASFCLLKFQKQMVVISSTLQHFFSVCLVIIARFSHSSSMSLRALFFLSGSAPFSFYCF